MTDKPTDAGSLPNPGRPKRCWCTAARCARRSARRRRRCFSPSRFVYANAEQAEARFKDEDPGFIYSRFSNPTVGMFEERMRLLEGAEAARATATGMAAVTSALLCFLKAGDHIVAARAHVRLVPLRGAGAVSALRHRLHAGRRPRYASLAARRAAQHQGVLLRDAGQPDARPGRHRRRVARSRTQPARWSSSTTCSPRPCCRSR